MRRLVSLLSLALVVLVAACTGDDPFVPTIETANFAPSLNVNLAASTRTASGLYYRDVTVGNGIEMPATGNKTVTVNYAGYLRNGVMFDDGSNVSFSTAGLIAGFNEGLRGMKVGGVRQMIIPPALGYGSAGTGGIPGNSILVFNVTLLGVN
jgi:FKBP-type peptidyl-prolyl cis-trans isomerase